MKKKRQFKQNDLYSTLLNNAAKAIARLLRSEGKYDEVNKRDLRTEAHREVHRIYKKKGIKHFGNFKPIKPFQY